MASDDDTTRHASTWRRQAVPFGVVLLAYALAVWARWMPQPLRELGEPHATLAWLAGVFAALQFHGGLVLLVLTARAAFARAWIPVVFALPLIAWLVVWPTVHRATPAKRDGESLRIVSANLLVGNERRVDDVVDELLEARPDIVLLQEYSDSWDREIAPKLQAADFFPAVVETRDDSFGMAIYDPTPRAADHVERLSLGTGETPQFRHVVEHDGTDIAIYEVHTVPPSSRAYAQQARIEFDDLLEQLDDEPLPAVVVGDFNATTDSAQHRAMLDHGFRDAWQLAGDGRGATWLPPSLPGFVPGIGIDHAYVSSDVRVTRVTRGDANGSDHRPLIVDIALTS